MTRASGYIVVRYNNPQHSAIVSWMRDDTLLSDVMQEWLVGGETTEILDYCTTTDALAVAVSRWREHFKKEQTQ